MYTIIELTEDLRIIFSALYVIALIELLYVLNAMFTLFLFLFKILAN